MKINFVFDDLSHDGTPFGNIVSFVNTFSPRTQQLTNHLLNPAWNHYWPLYSDWDFTFKSTGNANSPHEVRFISTDEIDDHRGELNIYPVFHGNHALVPGIPVAFAPEILQHIGSNLIKHINTNNLKVAILNIYDPATRPALENVMIFNTIADYVGIMRKDNIVLVFCDNDEHVREINQHVSVTGKTASITALNANYYQKLTLQWLTRFPIQWDPLEEYQKNTDKRCSFVYLNNRPTTQRFVMYKILQEKNLLGHGIISWRQAHTEPAESCMRGLLRDTEYYDPLWHFIANDPSIIRTLPPHEPPIANFDPGCNGVSYNREWISDSWFTLYTETAYTQTFLSEKTYKLFYYGHPFICLGMKGTLAKIRNLGYKTFPMLFDESYDDLDEHSLKKFEMIAEQIRQYSSPEGKKKLIAVLPELVETLEYNRNLFINRDHHEIWASLANRGYP